MFKKLLSSCLLFIAFIVPAQQVEFTLSVSIEVPDIQADPYHRPYVAIWLETPKRKGIHTFAFWAEQEDWFKDLRQWWRKIGRKNKPNYDSVTGATRKPGVYKMAWQGQLVSGELIPAGEYVIHIESVREQGSREYIRQKVQLGTNERQQYRLQGKTEIGQINIQIN